MYIQITDGKLTAWGSYPFNGYTKEVPNIDYVDFGNNPGKYIFKNNDIVINPDWQAEQELKEKERIAMLNMTKLDFANCLSKAGVSYASLKEVIASNEAAQMQWDLCERVYRFNPLLDELAKGFGITPEQLDTMFKQANGEVV
jgi:hypothetical protein